MNNNIKEKIEKYCIKHPKIDMECYHCGHVFKADSKSFFANINYRTKCPKCKESLIIDSTTAYSLLNY